MVPHLSPWDELHLSFVHPKSSQLFRLHRMHVRQSQLLEANSEPSTNGTWGSTNGGERPIIGFLKVYVVESVYSLLWSRFDGGSQQHFGFSSCRPVFWSRKNSEQFHFGDFDAEVLEGVIGRVRDNLELSLNICNINRIFSIHDSGFEAQLNQRLN